MPRPTWLQRLPFSPLPTFEKESDDNSTNTNTSRKRPYLFYTVLLLNLSILLLALDKLLSHTYRPGNIFTPAPHNSLLLTPITPNTSFQSTLHEYDDLWHGLMGGSGGILKLEGMTHSVGISMFHQLHCLGQIRDALQLAQAGHEIGFDMTSNIAEVKGVRGHWPHCFDYLRQMILCAADDGIQEWSVEEGDVSGYGVRMCRNPQRLYDLTACGREGCPNKYGIMPHREDMESTLKYGT